MSHNDNNNVKKRTRGIDPFVVLLAVIVIATLATYVVSPGSFEREIMDGKTVIVPDSYHEIDKNPLNLLSIFQAVPNGLVGAAEIMFLIMLIGGCLEVYNRTGAIDKGISKIVLASEKVGSTIILVGIMFIFSVLGGLLGWADQVIPFVPLIISVCLALGYDSLVGIAVSGFICLISFAISPINIGTVGIAHEIADLPMFSGAWLRFIILIIFDLVVVAFTLRYASKVKKDPSKSLIADVDTSSLEKDYSEIAKEKMSLNQIIALTVFGITFAVAIYGVARLDWSINDLTAAFVFSGIAAGIICRLEAGKITSGFIEGIKSSLNGAMLVGLARGIQWTLDSGGLIDPMVNVLSKMLTNLPLWGTAIGSFLAISLLNGLISSGSGKAMAFIPILVPLADLIGITRQTMVLAFQLGDGITNMLWFTNGTLLIFLSYAKIPLKRWYKFVVPIQIILFIVACISLLVATKIGYGPF